MGIDDDDSVLDGNLLTWYTPSISSALVFSDMAELTNRQKLQLACRAYGIYSAQLKHIKRHLASLRLLILDKDAIIKNVGLRVDLGLLIEDDKEIEISESNNTILFPKHLGDKAGAFYHKTVHENEDLLTNITNLWHKYSIIPSENISYQQLISTAHRVELEKISTPSVCPKCHLCGREYHLICVGLEENQNVWFCEACGPKYEQMMSMNETDTGNLLTLYERGNEIYRQQLRYLEEEIAQLRETMEEKKEIIEDFFVELGGDEEPSKSISIDDDYDSDAEMLVEEYRMSMFGNATREILRNVGLRKLMELQMQHRVIIIGYWRSDNDILRLNLPALVMELVLCFYSHWSSVQVDNS